MRHGVAFYREILRSVRHAQLDIAAAVDPERLRDIMSELLRRSTDVVRRYGGIVDKFTGSLGFEADMAQASAMS